MSGRSAIRWRCFDTVDELQHVAVRGIAAAADAATRARGTFSIVLAGGRTPQAVYRSLRGLTCAWAAWQIYFGDERCLPSANPERNSRMACDAWLDHVSLPAGNLHIIPAELGAKEGAESYARTLRDVGDFDLVMLGLGDDGHTASLFPGHNWGVGGGADVLAVRDAPKLPAERISMSAARLSRARKVMFLITGEAKRDAVRRWRTGDNIPARAITPPAGVDVLLDRAAMP